jgi:hypothetical protein
MVTARLDLGVSHRASMKRRRFLKIRRTSTRREGVNCVTDFGNGVPKRSIYPEYSAFKSSNEGRFVALGQQVDLTQLRAPIFLLAANNDEVVSVDQLFATTRLVGTLPESFEKMTEPCGHLSLFLGSKALDGSWRKISRWLSSELKEPEIVP